MNEVLLHLHSGQFGGLWFFGVSKGFGTGQNEENYRHEFLGKIPGLYKVQKLRNLIFFILGGLEVVFLWEFEGFE